MESFSQPIYTQALPNGESANPSIASTSQQPAAAGAASLPAVIDSQTQPDPASQSPKSFPTSVFAPFPEQSPTDPPLVGFASIPSRAAVLPNAVPYTRPTPYEIPPIQYGAGLSQNPPARRIVDESEASKMRPDELREAGVVRDEEIQKISIEELKKMGLGRVPSGFCYSARMTLHKPLEKSSKGDDPHPEQPAPTGLVNRMQRVAVREALREEVTLVHSEGHWDRVRATGCTSVSRAWWNLCRAPTLQRSLKLPPDLPNLSLAVQSVEYLETCTEFFDRLSLYVNPDSAFAARLSCGGVIEMCRAVAEGQIRNGFAIVRPPGHHAEPEEAMGFCFFNNVAVSAKWLQTVYGAGGQRDVNGKEIKMKKVMILDWDVHHGNGTQKAFEDDPNVLYVSLHRHSDGFYPGGTYGALDSVGSGAGRGFSVNIPFPDTGMTDADYIYAFQQIVMPIAYEFAPDIVLVSAGYDAAIGDELGKMKVSPGGYAHMTHLLSVLAGGKLVLALEGGYNVESVVKSSHACVEVLVGDEPPHLPSLGAASLSATNTVHEVMRMQSQFWKSMGAALSKAGKTVSLSEMLKAHRVYELYHEYQLFNIELSSPTLEEAFSNQLLLSEDVYDADTLLVFMHDLHPRLSTRISNGPSWSVFLLFLARSKAACDPERRFSLQLDTSREVLDWARDNEFGVVDVNFLAHLPTVKGQLPDPSRDRKLERELALYVWDNIVGYVVFSPGFTDPASDRQIRLSRLSTARNIILFGSGAGCSALVQIVQNRGGKLISSASQNHPLTARTNLARANSHSHAATVVQRVRACISVLGHEAPPELEASSGVRPWYKQNSFVLLPSTHPLHEDARRAGKHQKKYGNIHRAGADDESRPTHLLRASMPKIKDFIAAKLPPPPVVESSGGEDIVMTNGEAPSPTAASNGAVAAAAAAS
ncbi:SPOSA6832_05110, partial [Sporobolomyces salmonicolor]